MAEFCTIATGALEENCYLLWQAGRAWIIDPGAESDRIIHALESRGLEPSAILLTHGHFDHVGALDDLLERWQALPVLLHAADQAWAFDHPFNAYPPLYVHQKRPATLRDAPEGPLALGGLSARLLHTPGHTPGSLCILAKDADGKPICFTGDTLFQGSIGRTDLPGGSFAQISSSLKRLLADLPSETRLLPGHGPATDLAAERDTNPYLQPDVPLA